MSNFKVGDIVECIQPSYLGFAGERGKTYEILEVKDGGALIFKPPVTGANHGSSPSRFKLVEEEDKVEYEDNWHLNDGSVEIPDDAERLMNPEGTSVVAFRYVKKPKVTIHVRHVIQELDSPSEPYYTTSNGVSPNAVAKLTFITTDGKLTDIQWERV